MNAAPYSSEILTHLYNWQTVITGLIAIFAAWIAYRGSKFQADEARKLANEKAEGYSFSYAAMAALEAQRLSAESSDLISNVQAQRPSKNVSTIHVVHRIETREFMRTEWEAPAALGPDCAMAIYHLIEAIDAYNRAISKTEEINASWSIAALQAITGKADFVAKTLTDKLEKSLADE